LLPSAFVEVESIASWAWRREKKPPKKKRMAVTKSGKKFFFTGCRFREISYKYT
jgi:hypothetical protein